MNAMSNTRAIRLTWSGEGLRFSGSGTQPETPAVSIDGDGAAGPSPMLMLLLAAASCSGSDVVVILEKMRAGLRNLTVDVMGTRREQDPKRYTKITFRFTMSGAALDAAKAEHAVTLSLEKYCSVVHSLAPDMAVSHEIALV